MFNIARFTRFVIAILLVVVLSASIPVHSSAAADRPAVRDAANIPTQLFPSSTIPIKRIIYIWTEVPGATAYQLQVYRDATRILNKSLNSSVCVAGTCSFRHDTDLGNGTYNWRVRATVGGVIQAFSPWMSFTVSTPSPVTGFYSTFTNEAVGWMIHKGLWYLEGSNYFTTAGVQGYASTISHTDDYGTFTYEVRMRRDGCVGNANVIAIRGNPALDSVGWWNTEYTFDYTNNGYFSIWRDYYGTYTALRDWTYTNTINQGGWNTLKVKANGSSLYFYINNVLVWTGSDSTYASGRVGIGMYRGSGCAGDKLWVDYAKLDTTVADLPAGDLRLEIGDPVPGGDHNNAP